MATSISKDEDKDKSRLDDLQTIILSTLTYGSGSTSFESQLIKEGFSHQEVYVALEALQIAGTIHVTESGTEYSPVTDEIHEWRKYSLLNDPIRGLKVDIYRVSAKNKTAQL